MNSIARLVAAAALAFAVGAAQAQSYPSKPVQLVIPLAPGGPTDVMGRFVAQKLGERLGRGMLAENRPGAGGVVGAEAVVRSAPDGYTLLFASSAITIYPSLYKLTFNPEVDLVAISPAAIGPLALVVDPGLGIKSVAELIALAKSKPGGLAYGSGGNGTNPHLAAELFRQQAGITLVHVPYKGTAPALADLMAGRIQLVFDALLTTMPHIKSGKMNPLAVTSSGRSAMLPGVPTLKENGFPDYEVAPWFGLFAPKGTPGVIVEKINLEMEALVGSADARARFLDLAHEPYYLPAARFAEVVKNETRIWAQRVKASGAKVD